MLYLEAILIYLSFTCRLAFLEVSISRKRYPKTPHEWQVYVFALYGWPLLLACILIDSLSTRWHKFVAATWWLAAGLVLAWVLPVRALWFWAAYLLIFPIGPFCWSLSWPFSLWGSVWRVILSYLWPRQSKKP